MTVWAKISTPATAMACAACIATAATLPVMGAAAEKVAKTAAVKLSALTDIDAFSALGAPFFGTAAFDALPTYLAALGDPTALTGIDSLAAIPVFQQVLAGNIDALAGPAGDGEGGYAALSAVPAYVNGTLTDIDAISALGRPLTDIAAFDAVPNLVSFATTGDLSRATGLSGIDAFSALPALNAVLLNGDISALAPDQSDDAVGGYAAFSAIPAYLGIDPPVTAPDIPFVAPEAPAPETASTTLAPAAVSALAPGSGGSTTTPTNGANLRSAVPAAFSALVPPAPQAAPPVQQITPTVTEPDNSGEDSQNVVRDSQKFTPGQTGKSPILWGTANRGVENGMPGWQAGLKSLGLAPSGATPGGATPGSATPGGTSTPGAGQGTGTG